MKWNQRRCETSRKPCIIFMRLMIALDKEQRIYAESLAKKNFDSETLGGSKVLRSSFLNYRNLWKGVGSK